MKEWETEGSEGREGKEKKGRGRGKRWRKETEKRQEEIQGDTELETGTERSRWRNKDPPSIPRVPT